MSLHMLLKVLRALERFAAEIAFVRFERNMNSDVRRNVVALDRGGAAGVPLAGQVQVIGALPPNMTFANMILVLR
jgi:hypothetical protein